MSIGPIEEKANLGFTTVQRTRLVSAKAARNFFADPVYYIFLIGLAGLVAGLLLGLSFSWQLYAVLFVLAAWLLDRIRLKKYLASKREE